MRSFISWFEDEEGAKSLTEATLRAEGPPLSNLSLHGCTE